MQTIIKKAKVTVALFAVVSVLVSAFTSCSDSLEDVSSLGTSSESITQSSPVSDGENSAPSSETSGGDASFDESGDSSFEESGDTTSSGGNDTSGFEYEDVDFDKLKRINKDIYAWIRIPGTVIDYPILNREGDNSYYLHRNQYGYSDSNGSIFTEDFNKRDFSDPVTLIYGHNMSSGKMFGSIQKTYTNKAFFESHKELLIIMPDVTYTYEIFAAVPYDGLHLLYYYDFTSPIVFNAVINDMMSVRALNAVVDKNVKPTSKDKIVILSTCLKGDDSRRYLLLAVRKN